MKSIEEVIDNIVDEHKECRWMDASELREYLEVVAKAQKDIVIKISCEFMDKFFNDLYPRLEQGWGVVYREYMEKNDK